MYFINKGFWSDLIERAVSTAAQSALGVVTAAGFGLIDLASWQAVGVAAGSAGLVAVLKAFSAARSDKPAESDDEYVHYSVDDEEFVPEPEVSKE